MLLVNKRTLLAIAGVFWFIAGANVMLVGKLAYLDLAVDPLVLLILAIGTLAVFFVFFLRIFKPYSAKHAARVEAMAQARVSALQFMDRKGYIMIAFMMALGIGLRVSGLVPGWFIAFFYVGLGAALALTGVQFLIGWWRRR